MTHYFEDEIHQLESQLKRSRETAEMFGEPDHPRVAEYLLKLAELYRRYRPPPEPKHLRQRALELKEKILQLPDSLEVAAALSNFAAYHGLRGERAEAEPLYRRALAINELATLETMVKFYRSCDRDDQAEPYQKRLIAVMWEAIGPGDPEDTLSARVKALGPEHPDVAATAHQVAELFRVQARYHKAIPLYERSLAIRVKTLGADHSDLLADLDALKECYDKQAGKNKKAWEVGSRALSIRTKLILSKIRSSQR